jgi:hypothetical protein
MAVSATVNMKIKVRETFAQDGATSASVYYDDYGIVETWESTITNHPVTKVSADSIALVAGAKTVDLTALVGTNGAAVDGTGLKVQAVYLENPSTNANSMTFTKGASNGYELMDSATWRIVLKPGQKACLDLYDATPDVAAGVKAIDVVGTSTQAFKMILLLG